ncbi:hypothetical protein [Geothrix fuzhouensis]|uniref:hypothetical protein n=1 Tax=Geothrix fuzhouensis TaxID=2966451 RepID=UPI002149193E|nr:hypothetical protein [Geothrix fuzhouensis]
MPTVIDDKCLPYRLPLWHSVAMWLLCDRLKIPSWGWGVFWTLQVIIWTAAIVYTIGQKKKMLPGFGE